MPSGLRRTDWLRIGHWIPVHTFLLRSRQRKWVHTFCPAAEKTMVTWVKGGRDENERNANCLVLFDVAVAILA